MILKNLFKAHSGRLYLTFSLILIESLLALLFPLFIGFAIDDALNQQYEGAMLLGSLGLLTLIIGVSRRVFDSRLYARIYQRLGSKIVGELPEGKESQKSARLSMLKELVEFLENSSPELIGTMISLIGVIAIIGSLNIQVFIGSLIVTIPVFLTYWLSRKKTYTLNKASNDELEKQVEVLSSNNQEALKLHLNKMMKWNIKLSDLEALNFSLSWLSLIIFLIAAIILSAQVENVQYGALFALIMYVFQFLENVMNLPFFYQNWLRLKEILYRLDGRAE